MNWMRSYAILSALVAVSLAGIGLSNGEGLNATLLAEMRGACPEDYIEWYGERCAYIAGRGSTHTIPQAEELCVQKGMHLISAHSAEESIWMRDAVKRMGWYCFVLGLVPGSCQWYDRTPYDFDHMVSGEVCNENVESIAIYGTGDGHWQKFDGFIKSIICTVPRTDLSTPATSVRPTTTGSPQYSQQPSTKYTGPTPAFSTPGWLTSGIPSTPSPSTPTDSCGVCSFDAVWLDIVFAVDSSQSMQQDGIDDVQATIRTTLRHLQMERPEVRAGIIVYSDAAEVIYKLDSINSNSVAKAVKIPYRAQYGTNMESAIVKTMSHFDDFPNKAKARKVIVMFASGYRDGDYKSPLPMSVAFKAEGGIIITVDYSGLSTGPVPILGDVASAGYELNRTNSILDEMKQAFCDANCFCPTRSTGYTTGSPWSCEGRCTPSGGCYRVVELAAAQDDAEDDCQEKGGSLVSIHDDDHQQFVTNLYKGRKQFWIGLNARANMWTDRTPYDYSHWAPGQPDYSGDCVYSYQYSGLNTGWYSQKCENALPYGCSIRPCSASNKDCKP